MTSTTTGSIRLLGPEDRNSIIEIYEELKKAYEFPLGADWTVEKLRKELVAAKGYGHFNGSNQMQAFILFRVAADVREITLLATRKSAQGQRIMQKLMDYFLKSLSSASPVAKVWLEVHKENSPAKALYFAAGFKEQGVRKAYYKDGGDALLLEYKSLQ